MKFFVLFFLSILCLNQRINSQNSNYQSFKSITLLTSDAPDSCFITCYIIGTYTCQPCPPGANCKPCIGNHLMIADEATEKKNYIRLLTSDPEKYGKGKKYTFFVKLHKTNKKQVYEAVLIREKK
jgi:hypothetical protein